MSDPKFTRGPWSVKTRKSRFNPEVVIEDGVCGTDGEQIRLHGVTLTSSEEAIANSRLIATSPELLDMLRTMMDWAAEVSDEYLDGDPDVRRKYREDRQAARELIARALGDQQ
jgi:hypothetical protein